MTGYQIVELESIDRLITSQSGLEIQIALILWLIDYTKEDLNEEYIILDLIKVEYVNSYPAIGIRYLLEGLEDLESLVISKCEQALSTASVDELIVFWHKNANRVKEETNRF